MPTLNEGFRALLLGSTAVVDLVGANAVYPIRAARNKQLPYYTYQQIDGPREENLDAPARWATLRIQLDCWSDDYDQAKQMARQAELQCAGYVGGTITVGSTTVDLGAVLMVDEEESFGFSVDGSEQGPGSIRQDYQVTGTVT